MKLFPAIDATINEHSSIRIQPAEGSSSTLPALHFDPFGLIKVPSKATPADVILVTHDHYDHYSPEDIKLITSGNTHIVVSQSLAEAVAELGFSSERIHVMQPGGRLELEGVIIYAIASYNQNKQFHPKENNWVGYQVKYGETVIYVAGDTDATPELLDALMNSDLAFLPVGGTYTMTANEAATAVNVTSFRKGYLKTVVPTHYGTVVGTKEDGPAFAQAVAEGIEVVELLSF